MTNKHL